MTVQLVVEDKKLGAKAGDKLLSGNQSRPITSRECGIYCRQSIIQATEYNLGQLIHHYLTPVIVDVNVVKYKYSATRYRAVC